MSQQCQWNEKTSNNWLLYWQRCTSKLRKEKLVWSDHGGDLLKSAENLAAASMNVRRKTNMVRPCLDVCSKGIWTWSLLPCFTNYTLHSFCIRLQMQTCLTVILILINPCTHKNTSTHCAPLFFYSASRNSPLGVHQGHSDPPREEPGPDEVGGPPWGRL